MPKSQFGKKKFRQVTGDIKDDLALVTVLLDRLLENNLTAVDRNRIIAQLALANQRIAQALGDIEEMGERATDAAS